MVIDGSRKSQVISEIITCIDECITILILLITWGDTRFFKYMYLLMSSTSVWLMCRLADGTHNTAPLSLSSAGKLTLAVFTLVTLNQLLITFICIAKLI